MLFLLCLLAAAILGAGGYYVNQNANYGTFVEFLGGVAVCISIAVLIFTVICSYLWFQAGYRKDIINREFNASYSQAEVFYASDVIETIRQIQRQRIEINGDVLKNK